MCGRYTLIGPAKLREAYPEYAFEEFGEYRLPRYNIAPSQSVLGVVNDGTSRVRAMHWGIDGRINARAETIAARSVPFPCVLFADGFYEWRDGVPYRFALHDGGAFAFAGIWRPGEGGMADCAIVTVPANVLVAAVHHRMPAILTHEDASAWLQVRDADRTRISALLAPVPAERLSVQRASTRLNDARRDDPDVLIADDPVQERLF